MKKLIIIAMIAMTGAPVAASSINTEIAKHLDATYPITEKQIQVQVALLKKPKFEQALFGDFKLGSNDQNLDFDMHIINKAYKANKIDIHANARNLSSYYKSTYPSSYVNGACIIPGSPATILSLLPTQPISSTEVVEIKNMFEKLALLYGILLDTMLDNGIPEFQNFADLDYVNGKLMVGGDGNSDRHCFTQYGKKLKAMTVFGHIFGAKNGRNAWGFPQGVEISEFKTFLDGNKFSKVQLELYLTAAQFMEKYEHFFVSGIPSQEIELKISSFGESEDLGALLENSEPTEDDTAEELKLDSLDF